MERTPGTASTHVFLLLLLLPDWTSLTRADAHCLCYNFTVMFKSPPEQPWCKVQGQVDENTFLYCDCGTNKSINLSFLGKTVNATKEWEEQIKTLREVVKELRLKISDIKLENYTTTAPLTLQAKMCCQRTAGKRTGASWKFGFGGQTFLLFHSRSRNWTEVRPGARLMKEKWEKDRELNGFFKRLSEGDCNKWLRKFWDHWEKILEPTGK
ncbi:PREDICTED: NKG2D ligand 1-like [Chrysochloris asiatica]|uniref:NKG2D ligand 1-like n=1 Tax=Chrysochloris asiatica TaxID=185453 RepID=A0A9B0U0M0_CHRAS|nr:PREDICTED: NKG2D ligand 1-like [Chrysochloris asiatica]